MANVVSSFVVHIAVTTVCSGRECAYRVVLYASTTASSPRPHARGMKDRGGVHVRTKAPLSIVPFDTLLQYLKFTPVWDLRTSSRKKVSSHLRTRHSTARDMCLKCFLTQRPLRKRINRSLGLESSTAEPMAMRKTRARKHTAWDNSVHLT